MKEYKKRIADLLLEYRLEEVGAVLIEGPKWCGKTTTAEQQAKSVVYMADPDNQRKYAEMADLSMKMLLRGDSPRLIDEWQVIPRIWDAVRYEVDHRGDEGQFILTGSAVPASTEGVYHTGTGRFAWITMRPMSLWESGESTGEVSLAQLFKDEAEVEGYNKLSLDDIAFLTCRGGWPSSISKNRRAALRQAYDYYDAVIKSDVSKVDEVTRSSERTKLLLRSLSRSQGTQVSISAIRQDMVSNDDDSLSEKTIQEYIGALKKIFVVEDMPAWNPNLRSKTAIRSADTRYFVDPSIAVASLGLGPDDLKNDLETFGLLFETMCVRDLRVYADALDGNVYHFRDKNGLECDAVIHLRNGSYGLIEIKLGGSQAIEKGVATLTTLAGKIDTTKMKAPSFLMVLTAVGEYAYRRRDGVLVVPVGCLKD
ncbi:MAG: ATP-binding protein [Bacteroides sp.]